MHCQSDHAASDVDGTAPDSEGSERGWFHPDGLLFVLCLFVWPLAVGAVVVGSLGRLGRPE